MCQVLSVSLVQRNTLKKNTTCSGSRKGSGYLFWSLTPTTDLIAERSDGRAEFTL